MLRLIALVASLIMTTVSLTALAVGYRPAMEEKILLAVFACGSIIVAVWVSSPPKDMRPKWKRPIPGQRSVAEIRRELWPLLWMRHIWWILSVMLASASVGTGFVAWYKWPGEKIWIQSMPAMEGWVLASIATLMVTGSLVIRGWLMHLLAEGIIPLAQELRASLDVQRGGGEP